MNGLEWNNYRHEIMHKNARSQEIENVDGNNKNNDLKDL